MFAGASEPRTHSAIIWVLRIWLKRSIGDRGGLPPQNKVPQRRLLLVGGVFGGFVCARCSCRRREEEGEEGRVWERVYRHAAIQVWIPPRGFGAGIDEVRDIAVGEVDVSIPFRALSVDVVTEYR